MKNSLQFELSFPILMSSFGIFSQLENPTQINLYLANTQVDTTHKEQQANVWNTYSTAQPNYKLVFLPCYPETRTNK